LGRLSVDFECDSLSLLQKDSLDINEEDRDQISFAVNNLPSDKVVITHGTDTIRNTAERLSEIKDKTIILTGAMLPEKFKNTDAEFNLGMAVGAVQILEPGIYICLYGKVVDWKDFINK
jgi:L-asparaginase